MYIHLATRHDLHLVGLTCHRFMIGNHKFKYTLILCETLQKEIIIRHDMQQLYQLGCDWTDNNCMFLHQGVKVLINSVDAFTDMTYLKTISNIEIPAYSIVTIPIRKTGKCITSEPCIFEVETSEIIGVQNPPLVLLPTVHLKD